MNPVGSTLQLIGLVIAILLTCAVFSRLVGNNAVFRFSQSLFVGVVTGYILALVWRAVVWPRATLFIQEPAQYWYYGLFFLLGVMLLARGLRATSVLANLPLGMLFGIGAALTLGGALAGTLIPQVRALFMPFETRPAASSWPYWIIILNGVLATLGTLAVLGTFQLTRGRSQLGRSLYRVWALLSRTLGRGLIMVTLGALVAGALVSFYTLLIGRIAFLLSAVSAILTRLGFGQ